MPEYEQSDRIHWIVKRSDIFRQSDILVKNFKRDGSAAAYDAVLTLI